MFARFWFPILLIYVFFLDHCSAVKTRGVFYVMGSDGIYVIDPVEPRLVTKITNTSSPGLCTKSNNTYSRSSCSFNKAIVVDDSLFVADAPGGAVKVIDLETQKMTETIPTDPLPYGMYYLPWRKEIWVHSWKNSTFDVIETKNRMRTHKAVRAHIRAGFTHGIMLAYKNLLDGQTGFVSHMWQPGAHRINLTSKAYSGFINLTQYRCTGTYGLAFSPVNEELFINCLKKGRNSSLIQMSVAYLNVTKVWNIPGSPFASPNGRFIVVLHSPVNETSRKLLDSRMNVIEITKSKSINPYPELRIPGGVSRVSFYPKRSDPESYYAFVTLKYDNRTAVVDLDLAKKGNLSDVTYIGNVGEMDIRSHGLSRGIVSGGKWIISQATKSKMVVIIDADNRTLHGKVQNVSGGGFAVWVEGGGNGTTPTDAAGGTTPTDAAGGTPATDAARGTTPTDAVGGTTPNGASSLGPLRVMALVGVSIILDFIISSNLKYFNNEASRKRKTADDVTLSF